MSWRLGTFYKIERREPKKFKLQNHKLINANAVSRQLVAIFQKSVDTAKGGEA